MGDHLLRVGGHGLCRHVGTLDSQYRLAGKALQRTDQNIDPVRGSHPLTGASTLQVWRYGVTPQILAPYLAFTIYRWDINIRMATIVGFVGGGGIGLALYQEQQLLAWRNVGLIMWLIALVVWVMDMFSAHIREKLIAN